MHTDPTLVHMVADRRREALLAESADALRREPDRRQTRRARGAVGKLLTRLSSTAGWLVAEFEPRPCVASSPDPEPSLGQAAPS